MTDAFFVMRLIHVSTEIDDRKEDDWDRNVIEKDRNHSLQPLTVKLNLAELSLKEL